MRHSILMTFFISSALSIVPLALAEEAVPNFTTALMSEIQQSRQHRFAASVITLNDTQLASELATTVLEFFVRPGDRVAQGQALVSLDCRDAEDQLNLLSSRLSETQASLTQAQRLANRLSSLRERQLTDNISAEDAQSEVARQQSRLAAMNTEIQLAKRQIDRCTVKAPFEAAITAQHAGVGERTSPGSLLLSLQQLSDAEIEVTLPVNRFDLHGGVKAEFELGDDRFPVELIRQSPVIDTRNRSQKAWYQAPESVTIGSSGTLILTEAQPLIPAEYIVSRSGQLGIFTLLENELSFYPLIDAQEGRPHPVPSELENAQIVIQGQQWLQVGSAE